MICGVRHPRRCTLRAVKAKDIDIFPERSQHHPMRVLCRCCKDCTFLLPTGDRTTSFMAYSAPVVRLPDGRIRLRTKTSYLETASTTQRGFSTVVEKIVRYDSPPTERQPRCSAAAARGEAPADSRIGRRLFAVFGSRYAPSAR